LNWNGQKLMNERTMHRPALARLVATGALAALVALAGCGKESDEKAAARKNGAAAKAALKAEDRLATAVGGKATAPLDLKYDLAAKPGVAQPVQVSLEFEPRAAADSIELEVSGVPGLEVVNAGTTRFQPVVSGQALKSTVVVQANQAGIYYVNVVARMVTRVQTEVRTFSVPVVVGDPPVAQKPAPAKDASGQPIQSMPALDVPDQKK
jgi:hypothetical protein